LATTEFIKGSNMLKSSATIVALMIASSALAQNAPPPGAGIPSPEQIFAFMDANKDGFIAKDEAKGPMAQHFDHVDGDKDGKISTDELKTAMAAMRPPEPPQGETEETAE
jgi:Ca2+-binding EF-hand superfamily protein